VRLAQRQQRLALFLRRKRSKPPQQLPSIEHIGLPFSGFVLETNVCRRPIADIGCRWDTQVVRLERRRGCGMIDDDERPAGVPSEGGGILLLYDYFKHLTSLSILVLGGVLIVAKDFDPADVKPMSVLTAIIIISAGGVCSFMGSGEIVRAKNTATKPKKSLKFLTAAAPMLLAIGTGYFLGMFTDSLF
jgi:hypothetical protein